MDEDRSTLMGALWFFTAVTLVALFISAAVQRGLTTGHIILTLVILGVSVVGTIYFSRIQQPKAKRQSFEAMLHSLSDEERIALLRRLSDDRRETILDYMDDDGELTSRK